MRLDIKTILIHLGLFLVTVVTTTFAGSEWVYKPTSVEGYSWLDFVSGFSYSIPFLFILTVHEFGHYFTAVHYKVKTTLPYYIPFPFMLGTLGALIRFKTRVISKQQNFDIGIAGPLAGFVAALGILWYGFATLPPPEYVYQFHPEYAQYGLDYAQYVYRPDIMKAGTIDMVIGKNILFQFFEQFVGDPARIPNVHEIMHYPYLFAGFLSLVFTGLNLLPIGQLDGGHVSYGLFGFKGHRILASAVFIAFLSYAGLGAVVPGDKLPFFGELPHIFAILFYVGFLYMCLTGLRMGWMNHLMIAVLIFAVQYVSVIYFPNLTGYPGWLLFAFLIGRMIGVLHPPSEIEEPLSKGRKILGWIALGIFIICFAPQPIQTFLATPAAP